MNFHLAEPAFNVRIPSVLTATVRNTQEDVLSRRTRELLLGARASIEAAPPRVAELMAREVDTDEAWRRP